MGFPLHYLLKTAAVGFYCFVLRAAVCLVNRFTRCALKNHLQLQKLLSFAAMASAFTLKPKKLLLSTLKWKTKPIATEKRSHYTLFSKISLQSSRINCDTGISRCAASSTMRCFSSSLSLNVIFSCFIFFSSLLLPYIVLPYIVAVSGCCRLPPKKKEVK